MKFFKEKLNNSNIIYKYEVKDKTNKIKEGFSILHLSDIHLNNTYKKKKILNIYSKYFKNKIYDFCIITGDIVDNSLNKINNENLHFFKSINAKNKLFILGNNDYIKNSDDGNGYLKYNNFINKLEKIGFINLTNKKINYSNKNISFIGYDDIFSINNNNSSSSSKKINYKKYNIALTHNILSINNLSDYNLILSGHYHAGEINLFIFDGILWLKLRSILNKNYYLYKNIKNNIKKFKFKGLENINKECISIIHPGMHTSNITKKRFFTDKTGIVEININI